MHVHELPSSTALRIFVIILNFLRVRNKAIAHARRFASRRQPHIQIRVRVFRRRQRHHIARCVSVARKQVVHLAEVERTQRARFHAYGTLAPLHAARTPIAL